MVALIDIGNPVEYEQYVDEFDFANFATEHGGIRWAHSTTNLALHPGADEAAADAAVGEGTARR
jgi:hypothetical protein